MKCTKIAAILAALLAAASLSACATQSTPPPQKEESASVAAPSESSSAPVEASKEKLIMGMIENNSIEAAASLSAYEAGFEIVELPYTLKEFTSMNTMLLELEAGKINCISLPHSVAKYAQALNSKIQFDPSVYAPYTNFHMATRTEDATLNKALSDAIDSLKADGTMDQLTAEYLDTVQTNPVPIKLIEKEGAETYTVAITGDFPPMDYVAADGTPAGFNVALLNAIAEKTNYNFEVIQLESNARLTALESGKIDFLFWISNASVEGFKPPEEGVTLTSPYYREAIFPVSYSQAILKRLEQIAQELSGDLNRYNPDAYAGK